MGDLHVFLLAFDKRPATIARTTCGFASAIHRLCTWAGLPAPGAEVPTDRMAVLGAEQLPTGDERDTTAVAPKRPS